MTGGSPEAGPPTDAQVDAGWDDLLGEPSATVPAAVPLLAAPLPPPVVPPIAPPFAVTPAGSPFDVPTPAAARADGETPAEAPAVGETPMDASAVVAKPADLPADAATPAEAPTEAAAPTTSPDDATSAEAPTEAAAPTSSPDDAAPAASPDGATTPEPSDPRADTNEQPPRGPAQDVERAIEASGRLGAAVVEDDELGAARSGRRVRVVGRASQRDDEPAATSGSISVLDAAKETDEAQAPLPERPKVAVRPASSAGARRPPTAAPRASEATATGGWSWVGLAVIGAVIVGGLFFVQGRMRGNGASAEPPTRGDQVGSRAKATPSSKGGSAGSDRGATDAAQKPQSIPSADPDRDPDGDADRDPDPAPSGSPDTGASAGDDTPAPAAGPTPGGAADEAPDAAAGTAVAGTPAGGVPTDAAPTNTGRTDADPRAVPAGTSPEAAAAFKKIPASAGDGPPVGGIGLSGIHVDDIALGDEWAASRCAGETRTFSIAADKPVNVCLRIVHPREEEQLSVAWQQDGRTVRRSKIKVPDLHAYRTRAYLALRKEYVGPWTVRITSADGAEVASASFEVVE